ncbi:MAG TPA: hypothetical protein VK158_04840 [Acidobacteriota bacterium]|nr:hypothetical protein [Acidobacteriota bacterium]
MKHVIAVLLVLLLLTLSACDSTNVQPDSQIQPSTKSDWQVKDYSQSLKEEVQGSYDVPSLSEDTNSIIISAKKDTTEHVLKLQDNKYKELASFDRFNSTNIIHAKKLDITTINLVGHFGPESDLRLITQDSLINVQNQDVKIADFNLPEGSVRTGYLPEIALQFMQTKDQIFLATDWGRAYVYSDAKLSAPVYPSWIGASVSENNEMWITTGNEILKWNGTEFEKKFESRSIDDTIIESKAVIYVQGNVARRPIAIDSLYIINDNDIYITMFNKIYHFNGTNWTLDYENPNNTFSKINGNKNTIVAVGSNGIIVAKDNQKAWTIVHEPNFELGTLYSILFTQDGFWVGGQSQLYFARK